MNYNLLRPWESLDPWQKEYIAELGPCFLLCGRQVGKTTAMSIKAVELCIHHFKKGEFVLINSITEKQAYHVLAKCITYARIKYKSKIVEKGENKPTKHRLMFKNGTGIYCYAAGESGEGLRGFTIKKLMVDEGSRMSEEYYVATLPMLSVIKGSPDIASTPFGKRHPDGTEKFFFKCSRDKTFRHWYISGENCPRHSPEHLEQMRKTYTKLQYAQEYLAVFTDELQRLFEDGLLNEALTLQRRPHVLIQRKYYLGVDVAGLGSDETTFEIVEKSSSGQFVHVESHTEKHNKTTDTSQRIFALHERYNFRAIGIDATGVGFGVWCECTHKDSPVRRRVVSMQNVTAPVVKDGDPSIQTKKTEMYINLLRLLEGRHIRLLDDDEIKASLSSIQYEYLVSGSGKSRLNIFGSYTHIAEGLIRAAWLASQDQTLDVFAA